MGRARRGSTAANTIAPGREQVQGGQTRQAPADLTAYTLELNKRIIPANAVLHDFRLGPGPEGIAQHKPDVVSFHYDGEVNFNVAHEILGRTGAVKAA
jgi:hypothetical protein